MPPIAGTAFGRAKQRHNTEANYDSVNPVPAAGEILAAVNGPGDMVVKIGDGTSQWDDAIQLYPQAGGGGVGAIDSIAYIEAVPESLNTDTNGLDSFSVEWGAPVYRDVAYSPVVTRTWADTTVGSQIKLQQGYYYSVSVYFRLSLAGSFPYYRAGFEMSEHAPGSGHLVGLTIPDLLGNTYALGWIHTGPIVPGPAFPDDDGQMQFLLDHTVPSGLNYTPYGGGTFGQSRIYAVITRYANAA